MGSLIGEKGYTQCWLLLTTDNGGDFAGLRRLWQRSRLPIPHWCAHFNRQPISINGLSRRVGNIIGRVLVVLIQSSNISLMHSNMNHVFERNCNNNSLVNKIALNIQYISHYVVYTMRFISHIQNTCLVNLVSFSHFKGINLLACSPSFLP